MIFDCVGADEVAVEAWTLTGIRLAKMTPLELQEVRGVSGTSATASVTGARCLESTDLVPGDRRTSLLVVDAALTPDTTLILLTFPRLLER